MRNYKERMGKFIVFWFIWFIYSTPDTFTIIDITMSFWVIVPYNIQQWISYFNRWASRSSSSIGYVLWFIIRKIYIFYNENIITSIKMSPDNIGSISFINGYIRCSRNIRIYQNRIHPLCSIKVGIIHWIPTLPLFPYNPWIVVPVCCYSRITWISNNSWYICRCSPWNAIKSVWSDFFVEIYPKELVVYCITWPQRTGWLWWF